MTKYQKADKLFRQVLLDEATKDEGGRIFCPLSNSWLYPDQLHVCHFIPRDYIYLRYDKRNCILCAAYSNVTENGISVEGCNDSLHIVKYKKFIGEENIKILENIRKSGDKLLPSQLNKMIEEWQNQLSKK